MQTANEVHARGKIIATGKDRRGYSTITMVIRGRRPAIIKFVVDNLKSNIGIGDSVTVDGYTKAFSYHNEIQNKWTSVQYFVATSVKKNQTELKEKFGVESRYYGESSFRAYYAGEVSRRIDTNDPKWGKLTIKVDGTGEDKRASFITLSYLKTRMLPPFDYEKGDEVYIAASVNTPQKEIDGRTVNFENLTVEDIVKIKKVTEEKKQETGNGFLDEVADEEDS